jgi:hypothetical protein
MADCWSLSAVGGVSNVDVSQPRSCTQDIEYLGDVAGWRGWRGWSRAAIHRAANCNEETSSFREGAIHNLLCIRPTTE